MVSIWIKIQTEIIDRSNIQFGYIFKQQRSMHSANL